MDVENLELKLNPEFAKDEYIGIIFNTISKKSPDQVYEVTVNILTPIEVSGFSSMLYKTPNKNTTYYVGYIGVREFIKEFRYE